MNKLISLPFSCCPFCESTEGVYTKIVIYGMRRIFRYDGTTEDVTNNMYEGRGSSLYCLTCNRLIGSTQLLEKEKENK